MRSMIIRNAGTVGHSRNCRRGRNYGWGKFYIPLNQLVLTITLLNFVQPLLAPCHFTGPPH